jgi:hypothetical protein
LGKLVFPCTRVREAEDWPRQAAAENLRPSEDLLLDHLKESFRVNTCYFHFGLQAPDFVGPRHWLANDAIRSKFHERLVYSIKDALVQDVDRVPNLLFFAIDWLLICLELLLSQIFHFEVALKSHDRELVYIQRCLKMGVAAKLRLLHKLQTLNRWALYRLSQILQELYVQVI